MGNEKQMPPSLDLAFDWVKDVLYDQANIAEVYNTRIAALFSVATLIIGIGFPLAMKEFWGSVLIPLIPTIIAMTAYIFIVIAATYGFWFRRFYTLDEPVKIREEFWDLSHAEFKEEILTHTEDCYEKNEVNLRKKIRATYILIPLVAVEAICLVLAFWFPLL